MKVSSCVNVQDKTGGAYTVGFKLPSLKFPSFGKKVEVTHGAEGPHLVQSNKVQVICKESFLKGFVAVLGTAGAVIAYKFAAKALGVAALTVGGPYVWAAFAVVLAVVFVVAAFFHLSYTPKAPLEVPVVVKTPVEAQTVAQTFAQKALGYLNPFSYFSTATSQKEVEMIKS